ncbi:O-antigen ligase family protein [Clostridium perfringens]|uniref:O-antigen ligase family protein n=2 Tax=Clostridium perfringens TaxID=1502 RepID=UPI001CAFA1F2|nr:O-antigen ligase family protein [Clostridium perfringens]MDT7984934.1 O-antigen ligase family protein [Clostridium perfringens]MDT8040353.1 O-antigen ligase family protein [Clostridium perfringens]HBI6990592.1 O-antigen ligase family protein [Clostridium perfringens]HBI6992622.1 O-antigen ligase family protein [Clostridium perfringens]HBI6993705.1 O-antigen ligase family protein [Clostridium perfringens]
MDKFLKNLVVLILIFKSGSLYWSQYNGILNLVLGLIIIIFFLNKQLKIYKDSIRIFFILSFFMILSSTFSIFSGNNPNIKEVGYLIVQMCLMFFTSCCFSIKEFVKIYINQILVISIISVVCFILVNYFGIFDLPFKTVYTNGFQDYIITPYYTIGITHPYTKVLDFSRNSGVLWEPGAWQVMVNIAIIFLLKYNSLNNKNIFKFFILTITVLTIQSSTGYIILGINIFIYCKKYLNKIKNLKYMLVFIVILLSVCYFSPVKNVIYDKVIMKEESYDTRANDISSTYNIFFEKPIFGYGFDSTKYRARELEVGIFNNSNGLGICFASFGSIFTILYLYYLFKSLKKITNFGVGDMLLVSFIFILIHSTEWFIFKGILLFLVFPLRNEKRN